MKKLWIVLLALCLLLCGCAREGTEMAASTPGETQGSESLVTTVDELLAAIQPGAEILLGEGDFLLNEAENYGQEPLSQWYHWESLGNDVFQLKIHAGGLTIRGQGQDKTKLLMDHPWPNVLCIHDADNITIESMTLGHTEQTEGCEGGVIDLKNSTGITLRDLGLYGCGTTGVYAYDSKNIAVEGCDIYHCSVSGLYLADTQRVQVRDTRIHDLGGEYPVSYAIAISASSDITVADCTVEDNYVDHLVSVSRSTGVLLQDTVFRGNRLSDTAFHIDCENTVTLDNVTFEENEVRFWYNYDGFPALDPEGQAIAFEEPESDVEPGVAQAVATGEQEEIRVNNPTDFLKAIGPNRKIILDCELLDLGLVDDTSDGEYYQWEETYDGKELVIAGVSNMTIEAQGEDRKDHTISADPRYADVLSFERCDAITLKNFTAGHSKEPGYCAGGVLNFVNCGSILVDSCGLYGCGTLGVQSQYSQDLQVINCDIYECSYGGIQLLETRDVRLDGNTFRDLGGRTFQLSQCGNVTLNGQLLDSNYCGN